MTTAAAIQQRALPGSHLTIPRVALGCGNFGGVGSAPELFGAGLDERQAFELMDAAWEMGLWHFDTADAYGGGRSEAMIGRWIVSRGVRPTLTTKTFNPMDSGADRGLAPDRVRRQLASSLERLGVDRVELYLAHAFDPDVPLAETIAALEQLVDEGFTSAFGVSNFDAGQLRAARAAGPVSVVQNSHSLLDRRDSRELLPIVEELGVLYAAFSPLAGGWLTGKYRRGQPFPPGSRMTQRPEPYRGFEDGAVYQALEQLEARARARDVSMAGLALAWLLGDPRIGQVVVGPGRPEHLQPVREALQLPLSPTDRGELEALFAR